MLFFKLWYMLSNCFLLWLHSHHKIRNKTFVAWWCCFYFSVTLQSKVGDKWVPTPCLHTNTTTSINNNGYIAWELMGKEAMKWVCFHNNEDMASTFIILSLCRKLPSCHYRQLCTYQSHTLLYYIGGIMLYRFSKQNNTFHVYLKKSCLVAKLCGS